MHIQLVSLFIAAHFVNDIIHRRLINSNVLSGHHCGGMWRWGGGGGVHLYMQHYCSFVALHQN